MPIVLYSRRGCHLCEQAEDMLVACGVDADVIDVDADDTLRARFDLRVPVVEVDGLVVLEGRFDEAAVMRVVVRRGS